MSQLGATLAFPLGSDPPAFAYAHMMTKLLPPGKLWRLVVESVTSQFFEACADELARIHARAFDLLSESDPSTLNELLPEYERELDLEPLGTTAERKARVIAHLLARPRYRPVDFQTTLAPLFGLDPADVDVIETSHAQAVATGDVREIFRFYVHRDPGLPGAYFIDSAQALIDKIKPSHTAGYAIESISFLCDDPLSLCDRDLLGA